MKTTLTFSGIWAIFWFAAFLSMSAWAVKSFLAGQAVVGVTCLVFALLFLIGAAFLVRHQLHRFPRKG